MDSAAATESNAGADTQIDAAAAKRRRRWAPDVLRFKTSRLIDLDALPNSEEEGPRTDPPHSSAKRRRPKRPLLEDDGQLHDPMHASARRRRVKRSLNEDLDAILPPQPSADPEAVASSSMEIAEPVASGGQESQSLSAPSSSPGDPSVLSSDGSNHSSLPAVPLGDSTSSLQARSATAVRAARHDLDENLPEPAPEVPEETEPAVEEPAAEEPAAEEPDSDVREPAPEATEPASAGSEQASEASELVQGASGSAPEALEPAPEAPEPAPEAPEDAPMLPPAVLSSYEPDAEPDAEPCPEPEMPSVTAQKARPTAPSRPTRQLDPRLYDPVKPPRTPSSSSGAIPAASTTPAESTTASDATDQATSDQQAVPTALSTATTTTAPTAVPASKLRPPIAPNTLTPPTQLRPPVRQLPPSQIQPPLSSQQPPPHIQHPAAGANNTLSDPAPYTPVGEGDDPSSSSGGCLVTPFTASTVKNNSLSVKARPPLRNPSQSSASSAALPTSTTAKEPMAQAKAPEKIAEGACVKSASPITGGSDSLNGDFLSDQAWGLLVAAVRSCRSGPRGPLPHGPQPPGQQGARPPAPTQAPLRPSWPAPALVPGLSAASVPSKSQQGMTAGLPCSVSTLGKSQQAMAMPPHGSTGAPGKSQQVMLKSASFAPSLSKTGGSAALSPPGHPSTNPPSNSIHPPTPATYPSSSLGTRLSTAPVNTPSSTYPTMKAPTMQQTPSGCEAMPSQPLAPLTPLPPHMSASKPPPVAAPVPTPKPPPTQMPGSSAPVGMNGMTPATIPTTSPQMVKTSAPVPTSTPMTAPATPFPVSKNGAIPATAATTTTASTTNARSAAPALLLAKAPETPAPGRTHTSDAGPHVVTATMDADAPGPGVGGHARKSALRKRPNAPVVEVIELDLDDDEDCFQQNSSCLEPTPAKGVCVLSEPSSVKDFHMANEDEKVYLIERMIEFRVADLDEERLQTVAIPPDGKFPGGLEQYAETWSSVVIEESIALLRAELGRALGSPGTPVPATPCREYPDCWELDLLHGDWHGEGCFLSIALSSDGLLVISDGRNWSAQLGSPGTANWRNASSANRELSVRMKNWNVLEVYGVGFLKRAPCEIKPGSIVLMSWRSTGPNQPTFHCLGTAEICTVEHRRSSAVARCVPTVAASHRSRCEVRPVNSGVLSYSRELKAVWGIASVPETLQEDLYGLKDYKDTQLQKDPVPAGFERRAPAPCLKSLNASQLHAVEAACHMEAGFTLVWGPPGTGKSSMLVAMVNALHLREYERLHTAVERIVLGNSTSRSIDLQWHNAVRCAPRLLVTAGSNAAVQGLLNRVIEKNFLDRLGNVYEPWGIVRVGTAKEGVETSPVDLDSRVLALMRIPDQEIADRLKTVNMALNSLKSQVGKLHSDIKKLQEAVPLPVGWSAKISDSTDFVEYHDHLRKKATWVRPDPPPKGVACVQILDLPDAVRRLGELIKCADRWWQFEGEKERLSVLVKKGINSEGRGEKWLKAKLESSFLGRAHLVFATLNSAARLRPYAAQNEPFGAVVIDEAAQSTEPSVLIPLQLARSSRCVLVGDDRQLAPTVFSQENCFISRPLFERLRLLGHRAELLEEQYRMAPEISTFPRTYFYGGLLKDAPGMREKTRRAIHTVFPPLLFLDLGSSKSQRSKDNSWRNMEEARLVASLIGHLRTTVEELGESEITQDVGVVTPYNSHKDLVSQELVRMHGNQDGVTVTTVDGFQGRECEVIIFTTVRAPDAQSNALGIGFLADERRLNVALTRARSLMIVVGHGQTLVQSRAWSALMMHVRTIPGAYQFVKSSRDVGDLWNTLVNQATMGNATTGRGSFESSGSSR